MRDEGKYFVKWKIFGSIYFALYIYYLYKIYAAYEKYQHFLSFNIYVLLYNVLKSDFDRLINSKISKILFLLSVGVNGMASMSNISQKKEKRERSHITTYKNF